MTPRRHMIIATTKRPGVTIIGSLIDRLNNTVTRRRRSDTTKMGLIMNTAGMFSIALVIIHGWHTFA